MARTSRRRMVDMTIEGAAKALDDGLIFSSPVQWERDDACLLKPGEIGVQGYIDKEWYDQLKADPRYTESLLLIPGSAPGYYLHKKGLDYAVKYAINLSYVNRPADPIEF